MKASVAGAGPAGPCAAILTRRARPDVEVRAFEQNPPAATFGFAVVSGDAA